MDKRNKPEPPPAVPDCATVSVQYSGGTLTFPVNEAATLIVGITLAMETWKKS